MKKLIRLFTIMLTILLLAGCSANGYRYVEDGENSYISIDSLEVKEPGSSMGSGSVMAPAVYFSSVDEMKSDIKQGRFTEEELEELARFQKNSDGKILAPSIESLRSVTIPDKLEFEGICWYGGEGAYATLFLLKNEGVSGYLQPCQQEQMTEDLDKYIFNPSPGKYGIEKTEVVSNANGNVTGTAYYFTDLGGGKKKSIYYTFSDKETTYYVLEDYSINASTETMYELRIWGNNNSDCFRVYTNITNPDMIEPKLTINEISQLGFED